MNFFRILSSGVYTFAQKGRQRCISPWISLGLRGVLRNDLYFPDGKLCDPFDARRDPFYPVLSLGFPGFISDFEYDASRENHVVIFESDLLSYSPEERQIFLRDNDAEIPVPVRVRLSLGEAEILRGEFQEITEDFTSAVPANILAAEIRTGGLLLRFLRAFKDTDDPVERLRKRLDSDVLWEKSIAAHCRELGFGRDILRRKFEASYKIAPGEYRIRKRLAKIVSDLTYGDLSLKEIAAGIGMKNATHLSALIRARYGKTPSELRREFRGRSQEPFLTGS